MPLARAGIAPGYCPGKVDTSLSQFCTQHTHKPHATPFSFFPPLPNICTHTHTHTHTQQVTVVQQQYNGSSDLCYCVKSFVHNHTAVSPAFVEKDYSSREYSTWVESRCVYTMVEYTTCTKCFVFNNCMQVAIH